MANYGSVWISENRQSTYVKVPRLRLLNIHDVTSRLGKVQPSAFPENSFLPSKTGQGSYYEIADHKSSKRNKLTDLNQAINPSMVLRFNCTKPDHRGPECRRRTCLNCKGRHYSSSCYRETVEASMTDAQVGK